MASNIGSIRPRTLRLPTSLILWIGATLGVLALGLYASTVDSPGWEIGLVRFAQGLPIPGLRDLDLILTRVGHTPWALPLTGFAVAGLWALGKVRLGWFLAALTLGRVAGGLVKVMVDRSRPDAGQVDLAYVFGGPSFPSGHVLGTTLLLGWLIYALPQVIHRPALRYAAQAACLAGIVLMGVSRIELGAHWPTDVLGGYLLAGVMLLPMTSLDKSMQSSNRGILQWLRKAQDDENRIS